MDESKKFKIKLKPRNSEDHSKNTEKDQVLESELLDLNHAFEVFKQKASLCKNINQEDRIVLINKLLGHFQTINEIIQVINETSDQKDTMGNFMNTMRTQEKHNTYEISNDITLLNFGEQRLANIIDMFSDPEFITHIVRKDDFKNKYSVIVYDKKWDNKINSEVKNLGENTLFEKKCEQKPS